MLEKSNDNLPYCIALVERISAQAGSSKSDGEPVINDGERHGRVVGHSRLCRVHGLPRAAFVESGWFIAIK